mmetsp:Transcript_8615/g.24803  ORF Transcript_8615/g.24803 Transcript_8615/m.24803 type:complete len:545 (-) Transcript_8615:123-1757(-)
MNSIDTDSCSDLTLEERQSSSKVWEVAPPWAIFAEEVEGRNDPPLRRSMSEPAPTTTLESLPTVPSNDSAACALEPWSVSEVPARLDLWLAHLWKSRELFESDILAAKHGDRGAEAPVTGLLSGSHLPIREVSTYSIHSLCYVTLGWIGVLISLYMLAGVFLPLLIASGLAVLLEPLVFFLVDAFVRVATPQKRRPGLRGTMTPDGRLIVEQVQAPGAGRWSAVDCRNVLLRVIGAAYCELVVVVVVIGVVGLLGAVAAWVVASVESVDWNKYLQSSRMQLARAALARVGISDFEAAVEQAVPMIIEALGFEILDQSMSILSGGLLVLLFLGFFLMDLASARRDGKEPWRTGHRRLLIQVAAAASGQKLDLQTDAVASTSTLLGRLRLQMRAYIKGKFWLSVIKAFLIGGLFALLRVDLWIIWTMLTFVLNFMPLGSSVSTAAPIVFVVLDPAQSFLTAAICLAWPLLVHNLVGNLVEPRVFASSLNLHPVTVLLALTFWTTIWGVLGALVCVPLTACIRVVLLATREHPYVSPVVRLLEGRIS